ncbi:MAG: thiamine pyrophosphate-dependent dehydrogenase E1 component subunit alpha [Deltaproteobacteria bacterium]|nr:thiamine pyrophosphate-dependent dehydrogenase E1 component subunit alpha [Deltaproteobacteria bacterium]
MPITGDELVRLYRLMLLTRRTEETVDKLFQEGRIRTMGHWSTGQEAAGVGMAAALRRDDYLFPTHRAWPEFIGKGLSPASIVAEFIGKRTGCAKGRGGLHLSSAECGIVGLVGSLGADFPIAAGAALSAKMRKTDQVSCVYFGEGTAGQADFHPAMEMAVLWKLPIIFACANNQYVELHHYREVVPIEDIVDLAKGYHMNGVLVRDGNDVAAVYEATSEAVARARRGEGPTFLEFKTYRIAPHFTGDSGAYMPKDEVAAWRERDPIARCRARLASEGILPPGELAALEEGVEQEVREAIEFALDSPEPAAAEAFSGVYASGEVVS